MTKRGNSKAGWRWPWKEFFAVEFDVGLFSIWEVVLNLPVNFNKPT